MPKNKQKSTGHQSKLKSSYDLSRRFARTQRFWMQHMRWRVRITEEDAKSITRVAHIYPQSLTAMIIMNLYRINGKDPWSADFSNARKILTEHASVLELPAITEGDYNYYDSHGFKGR